VPLAPDRDASQASRTPEEDCPTECPACAHRGLEPARSLAAKKAWLQRSLAPWAAVLEDIQALPAARWTGYRDRVALSVRWQDGGWRYGVWRRDRLVPIPRCPVHSPRVRRVLAAVAGALPAPPAVRWAFHVQAGAQAALVLKQDREPPLDWLHAHLGRRLAAAGLEGLWLNLHPAAGRRLFAKRGWRLVWGQARSVDHGLQHGPAAFMQATPGLAARALDRACGFLEPGPDAAVVDLYCGLGAGLQRWTAAGARTLGVEIGGEAVECARVNAPGALLLRGACAARLPQVDAWLRECPDRRLLYVNPPRTGLEPAVCAWIGASMRPARMAYLSCSAGTLARDLARLERAGYRVQALCPFDFFPRTYHVEVLALLARAAP